MKKINERISLLLAIATLLALFAGCGKKTQEAANTNPQQASDNPTVTEAKPANADSAADYNGKLEFDHTMKLDYATKFKVDYYKGGYKLLTIYNRPEDALEGYIPKTSEFLIVPKGMKTPDKLDAGVKVLQAPITNILNASNGAVSQMNAIGALDSVSMVTTEEKSWYIDEVKTAMDAGKIKFIGSYKDPEYETIMSASSKLAIYSTMLASTPEVAQKLIDTCGMTIMLDQSSYEDHPLGRIEWMKLYGAVTDHEKEAEALFNDQKALVDKLSAKENSGKTVAVFFITSDGKLYVRNQKDYLTKMVELAGMKYIPDSIGADKTGTTNITMEAFYNAASQADYIIYLWSLGGQPSTLADLTAKDSILSEFKAVKDGNVWCTTQEFFQINDKLGTVIEDISKMQTTESDKLNYLFKLK